MIHNSAYTFIQESSFFCGRFYCPRFLQKKRKCLRFGKAINCFGETNPAVTKEPLKSLITETVV